MQPRRARISDGGSTAPLTIVFLVAITFMAGLLITAFATFDADDSTPSSPAVVLPDD